ncbi:MAG: hypothetical protein ABIN91_08205 [Mucilaginibacter sp.]|uniref:hypothetical protein n=1 Tax=Mucilaginibacter sp. TaxID=1882438 RepID=UPI003265120A
MRTIKYTLSGIIYCCLLFAISISAHAQRLPAVQKDPLRAPANVKIDGKATEWGQYQAYNKATVVYYSIANDNENLYLLVKAEKANMIKKSIMAGITLIINRSAKKNDTLGQVSITFPLIPRKEQFRINEDVDKMHRDVKDTASMSRRADTLMRLANKDIDATSKLILIKGVKDIADTLVSIYNEENVQASSRFDNKMNYIYELSVPLKYLGFSMDKRGPFAYHVKLNGASSRYVYEGSFTIRYVNGQQTISGNQINQDWVNTTDFWGEYTLIK